jgi:transcription termination factor Rho
MHKCPHLIPIMLREKELDIENTEFNFNSRKTRSDSSMTNPLVTGWRGLFVLVPAFSKPCKIQKVSDAVTTNRSDIY